MTQKISLNNLPKDRIFSRNELQKYFENIGFKKSKASFNNKLITLLKSGELIKVGHNSYAIGNSGFVVYTNTCSDIAENIANQLVTKYPLVDFRIFETNQLNEFMNHLIAHNTIIVYVEPVAIELVFEELKMLYPGKVLFDPNIDMYHQYWCENIIVVKKLISESPKGLDVPWHTRLEKMMVDIVTDKLLSDMIPENEIKNIIDLSLDKYTIDTSCLGRYAKRRKAFKKIEKYIPIENKKGNN